MPKKKVVSVISNSGSVNLLIDYARQASTDGATQFETTDQGNIEFIVPEEKGAVNNYIELIKIQQSVQELTEANKGFAIIMQDFSIENTRIQKKIQEWIKSK